MPKDSDTVLSITGNVVNDGGSMAFIGNAGYMGSIEIDGSLEGNKVLAINPNGIYFPGDSYDVSNLVNVNGEAFVFKATTPYKDGLLQGFYGNENKQITFSLTEAVADEAEKAAEEMGNLGRALAKEGKLDEELQAAGLFKMEVAKANKTLKAIKGQQSANIPAMMQQNNMVSNAVGMRMSQVNRAKSAKAVTLENPVQPEYEMWAKASRNKVAVNAESDYTTDAYSIGWDKLINREWRFGFFGSFAKGKFEADTIYNSLEDYRLGVYGGYNKGSAEILVYADLVGARTSSIAL